MAAISHFLGTLLKFVFEWVNDYGLAIVIFTLLVKLALVPLTLKQTKSMKEMQVIQPKVKEIQEKYKNDKEMMNQKVMALYQEHKVNPMAGCLPLLVQMPILFGLFRALKDPDIYVFGSMEVYKALDTSFLWMSNLSDPDLWILPILSALTTYVTSAMMQTTPKGQKKDPNQMMMTYMFPGMMFVMGRTLPAGLTLYWVVGNVFQIAQQYFIMKPVKK